MLKDITSTRPSPHLVSPLPSPLSPPPFLIFRHFNSLVRQSAVTEESDGEDDATEENPSEGGESAPAQSQDGQKAEEDNTIIPGEPKTEAQNPVLDEVTSHTPGHHPAVDAAAAQAEIDNDSLIGSPSSVVPESLPRLSVHSSQRDNPLESLEDEQPVQTPLIAVPDAMTEINSLFSEIFRDGKPYQTDKQPSADEATMVINVAREILVQIGHLEKEVKNTKFASMLAQGSKPIRFDLIP